MILSASKVALLALLGAASLTSGFVPQSSWDRGCRIANSGRQQQRGPRNSNNGAHVQKAGRIGRDRSTGQMTMVALPAAVSGAAAAVKTALLTGPNVQGVAALTAVSALAVVPLTMIRQAYSFSVGYGAAVAAMSLALLSAFGVPTTWSSADPVTASALLAYGGLIYGMRISSFLFLREMSVPSKSAQVKKLDRTAPPARIPFASAVAMFYAFMLSPVLYALRAQATGVPPTCAIGLVPSKVMQSVQWAGVLLAYIGLSIETIADHHKFMVKRQYGYATSFVGPTGGLYGLCRHPNYLGEIIFWAGMYLGGSVAFGRNVLAWAFGSLGLWGIVSIMKGATKRLDEKQADRYAGQLAYKSWREDVKAPLVPFVQSIG